MNSNICVKLASTFFVLIGFVLNLSHCSKDDQGLQMTSSCTDTQRIYHLKGFNDSAPNTAIPGSHLHICTADHSCCNSKMEDALLAQSTKQFENKIHDLNSKLEAAFQEKHKKFDDFFRELIENARKSSDSLFFRTYRQAYADNSAVFMELFKELKSYYKGSSVNVGEIFDNFFTVAMQKVFALINLQYVFTEEYMQCIADNMNTIQPFGSIPTVLSGRVQRSFTVARTFANGLEAGKVLSGSMTKFQATPECSKALMKMSQCGLCQGVLTVKPCRNMCLNVMKGCLCDFSDLSVAWNQYMDAMQMLLHRLEGPFNIETVLDPFDVKLSDAIMTLQENKKDITATVFAICGKPERNPNITFNHNFDESFTDLQDSFPPQSSSYIDSFPDIPNLDFSSDSDYAGTSSRNKRSLEEPKDSKPRSRKRRKRLRQSRSDRKERHLDRTGHKNTKKIEIAKNHRWMLHQPTMEESRYEYSEDKDAREKKKHSSVPTALGTNLSELVSEMRKMMEMARKYWNGLAKHICDSESNEDSHCWNGTSVGSYSPDVVGDGSQHQLSNPELIFDVEYTPSSSVQDEIARLRQVTIKLNVAYKGIDPRREDDDDDDTNIGFSGEGSAEGSGSSRLDDDKPDTRNIEAATKCPTCGANATSYSIVAMAIAVFWTLRFAA